MGRVVGTMRRHWVRANLPRRITPRASFATMHGPQTREGAALECVGILIPQGKTCVDERSYW